MAVTLRNPLSILLLAFVTWLAGGLAVDAMAQGLFTSNTSFTCVSGVPIGSLLVLGTGCPSGPEDGHVFSFFICEFEAMLNEMLGKVYCSVVWEVTPAIQAALTLLIALTGVSFLMGLTPFTAKELAVLGVKFCLVLAFATKAEYMIGYGYALFVGLAKEGIVVVLDYLFGNAMINNFFGITNFSGGDQVYLVFDTALNDMMSAATANEGDGAANPCQNSIFAMLVILAAAVPPMAFIGMYFLFRLLWMVLRAVFGYCQGLLGITFLTVLAPIYVSFALFKQTRTLFDKWVKYMISFGFQMVIVFAFIGMLFYILKHVADDFDAYMDLVQPYDQTVEQGPGIFNPISGCGICEMEPADLNDKPKCTSPLKVLPVTELSKNKEFMEFASVKALALVLLFYVLDIMIGFVPEMARHLAGPKYAGQLGGGGSYLKFPGEQAIGTSLGAGAQAFMKSSNSASGVVNGIVAGTRQAVTGERGIVDTAIRSLANPSDPYRSLQEMDNSPAGNLFGAAAGVTGAAALAKHYGIGSDLPDDAASQAANTAAQDQAAQQANQTANAALTAHVQSAIKALGDNPTQSDIEKAMSQISADPKERAAAVQAAIDSGELSSEAANVLRKYTTA